MFAVERTYSFWYKVGTHNDDQNKLRSLQIKEIKERSKQNQNKKKENYSPDASYKYASVKGREQFFEGET